MATAVAELVAMAHAYLRRQHEAHSAEPWKGPERWREGPTKKARKPMEKALRDAGLARCRRVWAWVLGSPHHRAVYLREQGYMWGETPWRPGNFEEYEELAQLPEGVAPARASPKGGDAFFAALDALAGTNGAIDVEWNEVDAAK